MGSLREKIEIYYQPDNTSKMVDYVNAVGPLLKKTYAEDKSITSKEILQCMTEGEVVTRKFRVRYDKRISAGMRVKYKGEIYNIKGISGDMENYHVYMYLICQKVEANVQNVKIKLITKYPTGNVINKKETEVWVGKKSMTRSEFYAAYATGLKIEFVFELSPYAFSTAKVTEGVKVYDATHVEYEGKEYAIIRTFETSINVMEITVGNG